MNLDIPPTSISSGATIAIDHGVLNSQTLSQVVAGLQSALRDTFEPALKRGEQTRSYDSTLLHPLSISQKGISHPYQSLSSTLSAFEAQVLNSNSSLGSESGSATSASGNPQLRLLALSKEYNALQLHELITKDGQDLSKRILDRRKRYVSPFPIASRGEEKAQQALEKIAKECGLELFPGADVDGMSVDGEGDAAKSATITMAGKGIVLDVDMETGGAGQVTAVRFSYGLEGSTDQGIDKLLSRQAKEGHWENFRSSLLELEQLDALIQPQSDGQADSTPDPFAMMKALALKVEEVFQAEL